MQKDHGRFVIFCVLFVFIYSVALCFFFLKILCIALPLSDEPSTKDSNTTTNNDDIAALNLKFRCIIQLLIESLKALPSKCTLEKLKLRKTLKSMIQRELEYLHSICDYDCTGGSDKKQRGLSLLRHDRSSSGIGNNNSNEMMSSTDLMEPGKKGLRNTY